MNYHDVFTMTIGGRQASGESSFPVINPATEQAFAQAPDCTRDQLDSAVASARLAWINWRHVPISERGARLVEIADRMTSHVDALASLLTREQGKPLAEARAEITLSAKWFRHFAKAELPIRNFDDSSGKKVVVRRGPLGVVAAITPWNFPISLASWKLAPALLAGNVVIIKPSPYTPLTTLKFVELIADVLPSGVINAISGGDALGPMVSSHPGIDKITFTGSTQTGKAVMRVASAQLKRLTLELGGNDPAVVLPDVDLNDTVEALFWAAFRNAGQVCVAAKRIYVHSDIYERFAELMAAKAATITPAAGESVGVRMGPVQNRTQFEQVRELIEETRGSGYRLLSDPGPMQGPGYFIRPTLVDNPPDDSSIVVKEPFGPVVPLLRFHSVDEVIRRANASEYGLGASVWSADIVVARMIAEQLDCGTVWINSAPVLSPAIPFGGHKQSGFGVENAEEGLLEFTQIQSIVG